MALFGTGSLYAVEAFTGYSPETTQVIENAFKRLPPGPLLDCHVHIVGTPEGGNGCEVNPKLFNYLYPVKRLSAHLFLKAGGNGKRDGFDAAYIERLLEMAKAFPRPIRLQILAMDHSYHADGRVDRARTDFFVPNAYVMKLAQAHPDLFVPVVSIHPYRKDALSELEKYARQGVRYVKWLPNAQNIDPASSKCDAFFATMARHDMTLLCHAGEEKAVDSKGRQHLGNPLRLRRALDAGVRVVVAHCASFGENVDLDHPGQKRSNFELFLRLMSEKRYEGKLLGDISAMTLFHRIPGPYQDLLQRPELHNRLLNGSDWPLPGIDLMIWTRPMQRLGMISERERKALGEIYEKNPLLFDFVLKCLFKDPKTGRQMAGSAFVGSRP